MGHDDWDDFDWEWVRKTPEQYQAWQFIETDEPVPQYPSFVNIQLKTLRPYVYVDETDDYHYLRDKEWVVHTEGYRIEVYTDVEFKSQFVRTPKP